MYYKNIHSRMNRFIDFVNETMQFFVDLIDRLSVFGTMGKLMLVMIISFTVSPIFYSIQRFCEVNLQYAVIWFVLVLADMVTGFSKHWKTHTISFRDFCLKTMEKVFVSFCGLAIFTAFSMSFVSGTVVSEYIVLFGQISVSIYIGGSALTNLYVLTSGRFPPIAFMERLKNFNKDGSIHNLTKE